MCKKTNNTGRRDKAAWADLIQGGSSICGEKTTQLPITEDCVCPQKKYQRIISSFRHWSLPAIPSSLVENALESGGRDSSEDLDKGENGIQRGVLLILIKVDKEKGG